MIDARKSGQFVLEDAVGKSRRCCWSCLPTGEESVKIARRRQRPGLEKLQTFVVTDSGRPGKAVPSRLHGLHCLFEVEAACEGQFEKIRPVHRGARPESVLTVRVPLTHSSIGMATAATTSSVVGTGNTLRRSVRAPRSPPGSGDPGCAQQPAHSTEGECESNQFQEPSLFFGSHHGQPPRGFSPPRGDIHV